jgi:hypothetical protein
LADDAPQDKGVPIAGLVIAALVVSTTIIAPAPFQLLRPPEPESFRYDLAKDQDVDARLWEDPFAVVRSYDEKTSKGAKTIEDRSSDAARCGKASAAVDSNVEPDRHGSCYFRQRLISHFGALGADPTAASNTRTVLLGVMVPGYSFVGSSEWRRRVRYAVIAGLNVAGYQPANSEQIGYFRARLQAAEDARVAAEQQNLIVPFERFTPRDRGGADVLLLWLDETALGGRWIAKLANLFNNILPSCDGHDGPKEGGGSYPLRFIGPSNSDMLASAGEELRGGSADYAKAKALSCGFTQLTQARFFSPFATARDVSAPKQLSMLRTVLTDDLLIRSLTDELSNRGVDVCHDAVAVVGEWDSLYARSLAEELSEAFRSRATSRGSCKLKLFRYSYLRGLDGVTAGEKPTKGDVTERSTESAKNVQAQSIEWPEGRDQRDYLRRLAARMRDEAVSGRRPIAAVGVFGSDVYDKLLVLQALRPTLPNAIFFTTDLDARLFHPRTFEWTRNVLVASSFGLALNSDLQGDVPPFRDVYQTAAFLATQVALHDACASTNGGIAKWRPESTEDCARPLSQATITDWLGEPRLYELGRSAPVSLLDSPDPPGVVHARTVRDHSMLYGSAIASFLVMVLAGFALLVVPSTPSLRCLRHGFGDASRRPSCIYVLASLELATFFFTAAVLWRLFQRLPSSAATAALAAVLLSLVAMSLAFPGMPWLHRGLARMRGRDIAAGGSVDASAAAIQLLLVVALLWWTFTHLQSAGPQGAREPVGFLRGVSAWPTELLRLVALVLTVVFLDHAWLGAIDNGDRLTRIYFRSEPRAMMWRSRRYWRCLYQARPGPLRGMIRAANRFAEVGIWSLGRHWFLKGRSDALRTVRGSLLWGEYLRRGRGWRRLVRVGFWTVTTLLLAFLCFRFFGNGQAPLVPVRGEADRLLFSTTLQASMIGFVVLIVTIADETMLSVKCIHVLGAGRTQYPAATVEHFATELGQRFREFWTRPISADVTRRECRGARHNSLLDDWIDIRLIADQTERIGRLIYAPFLILALLIVSRSPIFDDWPLPVWLAVIFAAYFLWPMVLAIFLQAFSLKVRRVALQRMRRDLLWLQGAEGVPAEVTGQFGTLIEQVRTIHKGAFVPFVKQPLVRAALAPLGSLGGVQLAQYLLMLQH